MIQLIHRKLRPGGECFVTLPSRSNRMYGRGPAAGPHAFVSPGMFQQLMGNDGESAAVHYFSSREDVMDFFRQFQITALRHEELHLASAGREQGGPPIWIRVPRAFFWRVMARKPELQ
jgi:hypothetical protein